VGPVVPALRCGRRVELEDAQRLHHLQAEEVKRFIVAVQQLLQRAPGKRPVLGEADDVERPSGTCSVGAQAGDLQERLLFLGDRGWGSGSTR
jgi:hypothetical protein